jgi:hypothetical protein
MGKSKFSNSQFEGWGDAFAGQEPVYSIFSPANALPVHHNEICCTFQNGLLFSRISCKIKEAKQQ